VAIALRAQRPALHDLWAADAGQDAQDEAEAPGARVQRRPLEEFVRGDYRFVVPYLDGIDLTEVPATDVLGGDEQEPFLLSYERIFVAGPGEYRRDDEGAWLRCTRSGSSQPSCERLSLVVDAANLSELAALSAPPTTGLPVVAPPGRVTIHVKAWNDALEKALGALDPSRYCLSIEVYELARGPTARLPTNVECLFAWETTNDAGEDRSRVEAYLRPLRRLRYAAIDSSAHLGLDLGLLAQNRGLRFLHLGYGIRVEQTAALGDLAELRFLGLRHVEGLERIDFATRLRELRRVNLDETQVRSLAPLAQLPHLRQVRADLTSLASLPVAGWPALDDLHVLCPELPLAASEAFAAHHPKVTVWHRWSRSLARAFEGVTRVRVVGERSFDVTDAGEIRRLAIERLVIDDARTDWSCRCDGDPKIELYRDEIRVARLAVHHGLALAWPGEWPRGAMLTKPAQHALVDWLDEHGLEAPRLELERQEVAGWPP
jgi:hypothetical protein